MKSKILVTGGLGFIGSNYSLRLLRRGVEVTILDNFSRKSAALNESWLKESKHASSLQIVSGDVRDSELVSRLSSGVGAVVHLAGQVAVTTSILDPQSDAESNILGTISVLEAARAQNEMPTLIFASSNKVYGSLKDIRLLEQPTRYRCLSHEWGISEAAALDANTPYGCSKLAAESYIKSYSSMYGLPAAILRQSCIYGPRQFGHEDQGWVGWLTRRAMQGEPITIFGDGKQVRDLLYIDDLLDAYDLILDNPDLTDGQAFNLGGGNKNSLSIWGDFGRWLENRLERAGNVNFQPAREGDQLFYVSDNRMFSGLSGWTPRMELGEGLERLVCWVEELTGLPSLSEARCAY